MSDSLPARAVDAAQPRWASCNSLTGGAAETSGERDCRRGIETLNSGLRGGVGFLRRPSVVARLVGVALVRARVGVVRSDCGRKLGAETIQLANRAIAAGLELADDRFDLRPAAFALLDDPPRAGAGRLGS